MVNMIYFVVRTCMKVHVWIMEHWKSLCTYSYKKCLGWMGNIIWNLGIDYEKLKV